MRECVSERELQERRVKVDKFIAVGLKEKPNFIKKISVITILIK